MKTVYLRDENHNWKQFEYDGDIREELKDIFAKNKINIGDGASIGYSASIGDGASIGDRAYIGDGASIGNRASIGYRASIGNGALIGNGAYIGDYVSIGNYASIGNDVKLLTGLYLTGTYHPVTYVGDGKLSIGCHCQKISWWEEHYEAVGRKERYSDDQIKEYGTYIKMAKLFYESLEVL